MFISRIVAGIDQNLRLAADTQAFQPGQFSRVEFDRYRNPLRLPQPVLAVLYCGKCSGRGLLPGAYPAANAANLALQYLAGHDIEDDGHFVAGIDVAEIVLRHVGADPQVMDGDQRQDRCTGLGKMPDIDPQIGHRTAGRRKDPGSCQIELGLLDSGTRTAQLGVVIAAVASRFLGLAQVGFGTLHLGQGFLACRLGNFQATYRDRPRVFFMQPFLAAGIFIGHPVARLGRLQRCAGRIDGGYRGIDRTNDRIVIGTAPLQGNLVLARIDLEQRLSRLYLVVVLDMDPEDFAGSLRGHWNDKRLDSRLRRVGGQAIANKVENQTHPNHRGDYRSPDARAFARWLGCLFCGRS